jgi:hypothetical protein
VVTLKGWCDKLALALVERAITVEQSIANEGLEHGTEPSWSLNLVGMVHQNRAEVLGRIKEDNAPGSEGKCAEIATFMMCATEKIETIIPELKRVAEQW